MNQTTRRADFDAKYSITPEYIDYIKNWKPPVPEAFAKQTIENLSKLEQQILKLYKIPIKIFTYLFPKYDLGKLIEFYHAK